MGVEKFEIILFSDTFVFQSSEKIEGKVLLKLNESTKADGETKNKNVIFVMLSEFVYVLAVTLTLYGVATVHWTETETTGSGVNRATQVKHFSDEEEYANHSVELWPSAEGIIYSPLPSPLL